MIAHNTIPPAVQRCWEENRKPTALEHEAQAFPLCILIEHLGFSGLVKWSEETNRFVFYTTDIAVAAYVWPQCLSDGPKEPIEAVLDMVTFGRICETLTKLSIFGLWGLYPVTGTEASTIGHVKVTDRIHELSSEIT